MKAYRNIGGVVREVDVDVGLDNLPILPPDTTVQPRPDPLPGHYVTVVDHSWVQIPVTVYVEAFSSKKQKKLDAMRMYKAWYMDQPVDVGGTLFDGDKNSRDLMAQALLLAREINSVPPFWVTNANTPYPLATIDDLKVIVTAVHNAFSTRFYTCEQLRAQIFAATTEAELDAVAIPQIPRGN